MNILVLTNVLPAPVLSFNRRENDVLIKTAELHEEMYPDVQYTFVFVLQTSFFNNFNKKKLKSREHTEFLALNSYSHAGRNIEIIAVPSFKWMEKLWPFYISLAYIRNRKRLRQIVKDKKIDLIHAHNLMADLGIAFELSKDVKLPFLVTVRKIGYLESLGKHIKKFAASATALISLGPYEKRISESLNDRSYLISHGIDKSFLSQQKEYSAQPLKIVTISRLLDWKNIDKILLALNEISGHFTFDIYGDGPHEDALKALVKNSAIQDKVRFHGFIPYEQVPATLAQYDLFVLPSYRELFGRVYIEAMACGLPIIGAKTTGMDGYITEGEQGFLVDHKDVKELKAAIRKFIDDESLKITMGRKAQAFSKDFSWDSVINKIDHVYRQAIS